MLLGRDRCLNEGEGGRGHTGTELPRPPPRRMSHGRDSCSLILMAKGYREAEKPRSTGWLSTGFFTSAANPWSSPQLGPNEEVKMPSGTPLLCSSSSLAGSRFSLLGFVPCLLFLATRRKGAQKKAWGSSQMAAPGEHCSLGHWRILSAGWASTEPTLPCIRAWGRRPPVLALAVISPILPL